MTITSLNIWYYLKRDFIKSYNKKIFNFIIYLYEVFFNFLNFIKIKNNKYIYLYINKENFYDFVKNLKNNVYIYANQLLDIIAVDYLSEIKYNRFEIIYVFLSTNKNIRIFVSIFFKQYDFVNSLVNLYSSSDWLEREIWDMYGIFFKNHSNLRRILTDYGFKGNPMRKDFPLSGFVEVRYDEVFKSIVIDSIELSQEYRFFKLENPWKSLNVL